MSEKLKLSLSSDTFAELKEDFDIVLNRTIGNMEMRKSDEATITLKLDISLTESSVNVGGDIQDITKPAFEHSISSVIQVKDKMTGKMKGEFAMVWDDDEGKYVLKKIDNGQLNLFDNDDKEVIEGEYTVPALDAPKEGDAYDPAKDINIPFGWLCQYIGKELIVAESNGIYTVRTKDNICPLLSSGFVPNSPFYCSADILADHVGHNVVCVGYGQGSILNVAIECVDCNATLFSMDAPDLAENNTDGSEDTSEETEAVEADQEDAEAEEKPGEACEDDGDEPGEGYDYDTPEG